MKEVVKSFLKQVIFWLLLFAAGRIIFLLYYLSYFKGIDFISILALFWHGLKLDVSTVCFIMIFPFIIYSVGLFFWRSWFRAVVRIYHFVILFVYSLIATGEIGIYEEWLTKLNSKVLKYLMHPSEIYNSSSTGSFFILLLILLIEVAGGIFAYNKWIHKKIIFPQGHYLRSVIIIPVTAFLILMGMRGGLQQIPVNQSDAYFSHHNILNQLAVNPAWNFFHSIHQNYNSLERNPFAFYDNAEAKKNVDHLLEVEKDTTEIFLDNTRPNIVMIILEGWSDDVIGSTGGEKGITPGFDSLAENGILFTNCFASGMRSDQGMACIFSGFPATPLATITLQPDKFSKLHGFPEQLISEGYKTSFYFGGQLIYGNIRGYIYHNKFETIIEGADFPSDVPRGKLGAHDEFLYPEIISCLKNEKEPFFSAAFTMSSHSPYDYPKPVNKFHFDIEADYANSVYYSDSCLFDFFKRAAKENWYKNTLFVVVADHGHSSHIRREVWNMDYQRMPLLFFGDVINENYKGKTYSMPVSQVDVASTLMHQLGLNSENYPWSKNIFNPYSNPSAFYSFEVGLGFVTPDGYYAYDDNTKSIIDSDLPAEKKDSIVKLGKSYLQRVYQEYFDY